LEERMTEPDLTDRRRFLAALGLAAGQDFLTSTPARGIESVDAEFLTRDIARELQPTGADLGSLFPDVERVADKASYRYSFLGDRFHDLEAFHTAGRQKILDLLLYRPARVDPKPEVVERVERDDHVREKLLFSTGPELRVPAYVLLPKGLTRPAPAIIDLH